VSWLALIKLEADLQARGKDRYIYRLGCLANLADNAVLVTGASAGIGASTAKLFAKAGSNVILVARRAEKLAEVKNVIEKEGKGKVVVIEADVSKREDIDAILGKTEGLEVDM
jgi:short-subunit dehydrogenase